jgi:hypothetical protein
LRLQIQMNQGGSNQPESGDLPPTVTSFNFATSGITPPNWSQVSAVVFEYADLLGNRYELDYPRTFGVQVEARLENQYASFLPTTTTGSRERLINVFVNVPANSVDATTPCFMQTGPPFPVSVQNQNRGVGIPYDSPTCIDRTSNITFLPDSPIPIDIFSLRDNLDTLGAPTLPQGAVFQFDVTPSFPVGLPTQTVVASLRNAEATTPGDYISIPNPATPTLKPAGFGIADAKLGQNLTVSWTLPPSATFQIESIQLTANVTAVPPPQSGQAQPPAFTIAPTCTINSIDLPTTATSGTLKLPTTCFGIPVTRAQFCVFINGTSPENKTTAACWFLE